MRIRSAPAGRVALGCFAVVLLTTTCEEPACGCSFPVTHWQATLTGGSHVPPVTTNATGSGTFRLVSDGQIVYTITMTSLPATAITTAALHQGAPNASSSVVAIGLCGTGNPTPSCATLVAPGVLIADTFAVTPAQLNQIRAYGMYANVSTVGNPTGEIRGQVRNEAP